MTDKLTDIASKSLGDSTSYAIYTDKFDSSLLNPMPREIARKGHGIKGDEFRGYDVWNCHEATFLLDNGLPLAGTLKFSYDCASDKMIESKSAKLYLNSFDMCKMGKTVESAVKNYEHQIKSDLTRVLGSDVVVAFHLPEQYKHATTPNKDGQCVNMHHPMEGFIDLISATSDDYCSSSKGAISQEYLESMEIDDYKGEKSHLVSIETGVGSRHAYYTNILRSRCRHTKQKDTGTALVSYASTKFIAPPSLLKQIISLREVNEFHEFCAEKLYVEIQKHLNLNDALNVTLLYSRRGSLDINPVRYSGFQTSNYDRMRAPGWLVEKTQGQ